MHAQQIKVHAKVCDKRRFERPASATSWGVLAAPKGADRGALATNAMQAEIAGAELPGEERRDRKALTYRNRSIAEEEDRRPSR